MFPDVDFHWFPLENPGLISIPLGFLLGWLGTVLSKEEPDAEQVRGAGGPLPHRHRRPLTVAADSTAAPRGPLVGPTTRPSPLSWHRAAVVVSGRHVGSQVPDIRIRVEGGGPRAHRHLRPSGHRPARLADRPVQPALHVLHARGGPAVAGQARPAHRRRDRPADPASPSPTSASRRSASPAASRCCAPAWSASSSACAALEPRPQMSLTTNGIGLKRTAARPARRPAWTGSTSRWTPCAPTSSRPSPAATATRTSRRPGGRPRGRPDPGQGQRRADAGAQRRRGPRPARLGRGARLRAALHRADAARRPARLEARRHDHRRRHPGVACAPASRSPPRAPASAAPPPPSAGSSTAARTASASSPPSPARSARACDRTRLTADGQVRTCLFATRGDRPARRAALRRPGRGDRPHLEAGDVGQEGRLRPRRPVVPPARPPDVGDRRLTAAARGAASRSRSRSSPRTLPLRRASRRPSGSRAPPGTATGARGAPRTPARSCGAPGCAASGCSRPAPRRRRRGSPWRNRCGVSGRSVTSDVHAVRPYEPHDKATPSSHGGSCPASVRRSDGGCGARTKYVTGDPAAGTGTS